MIEVTILAVLQGVAEFLPISSSGHLVIGEHLLGLGQTGMRLDVFLHLGTLVSILVFYFSRISSIFVSGDWKYCVKIIFSSFPAVAVDFVESMFSNVRMVGALLMFTGAVLIGTRFLPRGTKEVGFLQALLMGLGQALALLPGVSRSGMTLATARSGGVDPEKSAEFSFLMSAPLIAGAALLEVLKSLNADAAAVADVSWPLTIYGCVLSSVVGYFSLKLLVLALKGRWFWMFGPYCVAAGLVTLLCG